MRFKTRKEILRSKVEQLLASHHQTVGFLTGSLVKEEVITSEKAWAILAVLATYLKDTAARIESISRAVNNL